VARVQARERGRERVERVRYVASVASPDGDKHAIGLELEHGRRRMLRTPDPEGGEGRGDAALVWLAARGASAWLVRDRRPSFASAFALAFALLYLGRPMEWTLVYLDLVVCVAAWPALPRAGRALLLVGVMALLASQWAALVLTGLGAGLPLLMLQPADRPWETWLVLPVAWALTVWAARRLTGQHPMSGATTGSRATVTVHNRP